MIFIISKCLETIVGINFANIIYKDSYLCTKKQFQHRLIAYLFDEKAHYCKFIRRNIYKFIGEIILSDHFEMYSYSL